MSFADLKFPHILYLSAAGNYNPSKVYRVCKLKKTDIINQKFFGSPINTLDGKLYEFHYVSYSPNYETKRKDVLVTKGEDGKYIRLDENKDIWHKAMFQ